MYDKDQGAEKQGMPAVRQEDFPGISIYGGLQRSRKWPILEGSLTRGLKL
jgi:hypothetical protein